MRNRRLDDRRGTFFFVEFEGGADDVALVVDNENALYRGLDSGYGLLDVFSHFKLQLYNSKHIKSITQTPPNSHSSTLSYSLIH